MSIYSGAEVTIYEEASVDKAAVWSSAKAVRHGDLGPVRRKCTCRTRDRRGKQPRPAHRAGSMTTLLNVRARPGAAADDPPIASVRHNQAVPCGGSDGRDKPVGCASAKRGRVDPASVSIGAPKPRPSTIGAAERWVAVNLKEQTIVAYKGDQRCPPRFPPPVCLARPPSGVLRASRRLDTSVMAGPGYYIEDVTWTCFFYSGYALHAVIDRCLRPATQPRLCRPLPVRRWWSESTRRAGRTARPSMYGAECQTFEVFRNLEGLVPWKELNPP